MRKTVLILAGGKSLRFQSLDKCLMSFHNKPLMRHAIDNLADVADEIIVAARDEAQGNQIRAQLPPHVRLVCDQVKGFGPLAGMLSGLEHASFSYSLVIGCDMPFVTRAVVLWLFELAERGPYDAVVPRWENGLLEPLHAVYKNEPMIAAIREAINRGDRQILTVLRALSSVYFIDVNLLRELDAELKTFRNINTPEEFRSAQGWLSQRAL